MYKTENTSQSSASDKKEKEFNKVKSDKNNKNRPSANKNINYSILTNKKKILVANSYLQTEKNNFNEDSISNYDESKNYKLDLKKLKLNLDKEDKAKNSFINPMTQRECSFIQSSELNNSNFLDDGHNKENEVVICISNLDMKIDDSHFNNIAHKNNANSNNKNNNFLQKLNKNPSNNFDDNNFYGKDYAKNCKNNVQKINKNEINFKENSSIKSKFEEIQLNLSKIKNKREKNLFNDPSTYEISSKNKNKLNKFDDVNNQTNSNRSDNKDVLATRKDKVLDPKHVETEYLETDENIKVYKNKKRRLIFCIIIIFFSVLIIFGLLVKIFTLSI